MSDKVTKIIAVFALIFLTGILVSAFVPKREEETADPVGGISVPVAETSSAAPQPEESDAPQMKAETQNYLYYYNALSDEEKTVYSQMYRAILDREEVTLDTKDQGVVKKVFECVTNDHPEIFYCSAYEIESMEAYGQIVQIKFKANYHMTEETVQECFRQIEDYVDRCIRSVPSGADEYTRVKHVYEYIIQNTEYVPNAKNNQNICSVFIEGESVCMGYAKATQYILSKMGMDVTLAFGSVGGESHSWNLVRVDGEYYYMDTTWGDAGYVRPGAAANATVGQGINYEYFLITTEQILRSHTIDNVVPLPACVATRNNYFIREGLYLRVYEEATLSAIFDRMQTGAEGSVAFQCADASAYQEVKQRLIFDQEVFDYMDNAGSVSYSYNDDLYTLIFWIE